MWRSAPRSSLPSTLMWSRCGSALLPSSVITWPFTVTRPCAISSSALRREEIPAAAMIFCRRSVATTSLPYFQRRLPQLLLHPHACVVDQRRRLAPLHSAECPPCPRPVVPLRRFPPLAPPAPMALPYPAHRWRRR